MIKVFVALNIIAAIGVGALLWNSYNAPADRPTVVPVIQSLLDSGWAHRFENEHCGDLIRLYGEESAQQPCIDRAVSSMHEEINSQYKLSRKEWADTMTKCFDKFGEDTCDDPGVFELVAHAYYRERLKK